MEASEQSNLATVDTFFKVSVWAMFFFFGTIFLDFILIFSGSTSLGVALPLIGFVVFMMPRVWGISLSKNPEIGALIEARKAKGKAALNRVKTLVIAKHLAGFEDLGISGGCGLFAADDGLHITHGKKQETIIRWSELIEVDAGSEDDLRKRVTVSRVLLTGIFALALKKERKKSFYVTVSTKSAVGLFEINDVGRDNRQLERKAEVFSTACNSKIRGASLDQQELTAPTHDALSQIERLGGLLEKGLITQLEYETKKSELLGRL